MLSICFYRNIFLGEVFSSYVSVHNDSNQPVKDIVIKVCSIWFYPAYTKASPLWLYTGNQCHLPRTFSWMKKAQAMIAWIAFQTDLQTSSQRLTLSGTANMPVAKLDPEESFDQVIQHEVKELGTHM